MVQLIDPWQVKEGDFPSRGSKADVLRFCLNYAVLAPSSHNTQPWIFKLLDDRVELHADTSRNLPVVDPQRRELVISCGAALFNLRLALRRFGFEDIVELLPNPYEPSLLARITYGDRVPCTPPIERLFRAIPHRHTYRGEFDSQIVFESTIDTLQSAAAEEGAWFQPVFAAEGRAAIAHLVAEADLIQMSSKEYRAELAEWMRPNFGEDLDGIPGYALGLNSLAASVAPLWVRFHDGGATASHKDADLINRAPLLGVIGTPNDTLGDWLAAGQALSHVLLQARINGVHAGFHNQPIEVPAFRSRLATLIHRPGLPQILLRLGQTAEPRPTPRRPVDQVLQFS